MLVPCKINRLSDEEIERIAREEFKEDEEEIDKALESLETWISSCPHLATTRKDREFLRIFYRGCNYNFEQFKIKYDLFYTVRTLLPNWFDNWDPELEEVKTAIATGFIVPARGYDKHGRIVLIVRQRFADPAVMTVDTLYKTFLMLFTIAMEGNSQAYCRGYVLLSDQEGISLKHAMMMTPGVLRQHMVVFQDSYPMDNQILINNSRLFIYNIPGLLGKFLDMVISAYDEKYRRILRTLPQADYKETLIEEVGEEILPEEYGGTNGTIDDLVEFWKKEVPRHAEYLRQQTQYKTDESVRPGRAKTSGDLFGSCSIM